MKIRSLLILCLLTVSTQTWSENKWLSYGNGMINLDNVNYITRGKTKHQEMYELSSLLYVLNPSDRCNGSYTWTFKEWVNAFKTDKEYLRIYSTEQIPSKETLLSSLEGYSDITLYETFKKWYEFKLEISDPGYSEYQDNMVLPVSEYDYKTWLSDESGNKIIEDTFNIKKQYMSNTIPMYHNSIYFDDFELWISGTSCDLNLVSSVSESDQLIQDTLSKVGKFIRSDKDYLELF